MKKNAPELWDNLWQPLTLEEDLYNLKKEELSIRWQRIESAVLEKCRSFKNLKVIEIGAGAGTNAALMAKRGAEVTVLDYSEKALERSQTFFERHKIEATFLLQDALNPDSSLLNKYDVSMSFGLAEHFREADRINIIKAHFNLLKEGGFAFISVPNKFNLPYRIYKLVAGIIGKWIVGEEYPFSRKELAKICEDMGIKKYRFFGDQFYSSFNLINPVRLVRKLMKIKTNYDLDLIKKEKGSPFDDFSYALVLMGEK